MPKTENRATILRVKGAKLDFETRPVPVPAAGDVLIRNHAIALNPVDWKRRDWGFAIASYPTILGSDVSGVVEAVGTDVKLFKAGDRVFGFANGLVTGNLDNCAFQTYTCVPDFTVGKIPDNMSFELAALLPMSLGTSGTALFHDLGIPLPVSAEIPKESAGSILIWGGASAVGSMAIQLARLAGYTVYSTSSPAHHAYLKELGAVAAFDYRSPAVVEDIVAAAKKAGQPITYAVDAIAEGETFGQTASVLAKSGGAGSKMAHLLPWPETKVVPEGVENINSMCDKCWGVRKDMSISLFHETVPVALATGTIIPSPRLRIIEGGLDGLEDALVILSKRVSAQKLVVSVK
ncbi:hypothetical protein IFR05_008887 [Cadophora sp. M221]|nr:hypothetical protein IFR05_008887 [Cadophora sp. M221]